jgi:hypothetical protein
MENTGAKIGVIILVILIIIFIVIALFGTLYYFYKQSLNNSAPVSTTKNPPSDNNNNNNEKDCSGYYSITGYEIDDTSFNVDSYDDVDIPECEDFCDTYGDDCQWFSFEKLAGNRTKCWLKKGN